MPGMRFEPNLSMLFTELPLLERPAAAAAAGFKAAELWWPFDGPEPPGAQVDELADAFAAAGMDFACLNLYGGDFSTGERGLTSVPGSEAVFRANLDPAMELVGRLRCRTINALFGNRDPESTPARQAGLAIENLALAAAAAARFGAQLVVEALNPVEYPRYGLNQSADVIAFLDRARAAGVEARCSFDLYHVVMGGEDPVAIVARHADRIGHVQVADVPGRHEPGTGTVSEPDRTARRRLVLDIASQEGGRVALVRQGHVVAIDVAPYLNIRTRVHEYGGGAWTVRDGVVVLGVGE